MASRRPALVGPWAERDMAAVLDDALHALAHPGLRRRLAGWARARQEIVSSAFALPLDRRRAVERVCEKVEAHVLGRGES